MKILSWEKLEQYTFEVEDNEKLFNVVWNKDQHNEGQNNYTSFPIPEYEITDEDGEFVEQGTEQFNNIVNTIKSYEV
jgi:hypothetical protein